LSFSSSGKGQIKERGARPNHSHRGVKLPDKNPAKRRNKRKTSTHISSSQHTPSQVLETRKNAKAPPEVFELHTCKIPGNKTKVKQFQTILLLLLPILPLLGP
jgi:hypothetical protein